MVDMKGKNAESLKSASKVQLEGVITPTDWDEDDNIISISISTPDEQEYIVKEDPVGDELIDLVYGFVKVRGILAEDEFGNKSISVESYELIELE